MTHRQYQLWRESAKSEALADEYWLDIEDEPSEDMLTHLAPSLMLKAEHDGMPWMPGDYTLRCQGHRSELFKVVTDD